MNKYKLRDNVRTFQCQCSRVTCPPFFYSKFDVEGRQRAKTLVEEWKSYNEDMRKKARLTYQEAKSYQHKSDKEALTTELDVNCW